MKIGDFLEKPLWRRRISKQQMNLKPFEVSASMDMKQQLMFDNGREKLMTQSDFLDELCPNSHLIYNVHHRSNRPKMEYNEQTKENKLIGFEEVSRVAVALQESILRKKAVSTFGNDIWFGNEGSGEQSDEIINIKSHWNMTGMRNALLEFARSAYGTGDGAIYLYKDGNRINYKTFSFENGDVIAENEDPETGERVFVRMYQIDDKQLVELYRKNTIETWVQTDDEGFIKKWWKKNVSKTLSEDGYRLVKEHNHGLGMCPVSYHRESDVCWGAGQLTIERIEQILSDLAENNKYYAFQILFITGGAMKLPDSMWQGKVIGGRFDGADAKILQPADCSNSFTLDLKENSDYLYEVTSTTTVTPDQLKGGDYSGAYLRNLYFRDVQWTTEASGRLDQFMKRLIDIFCALVGQIEQKTIGYSKLRLSYKIIPYIPQNELEEHTILAMGVNSGYLSVQTATEESPRSNPEEMKRILEEQEAADQRKANEGENANLPNVEIPTDNIDNKAKGSPMK